MSLARLALRAAVGARSMTTKAAAAQAVTAPVVAQKAPYEIDVEVGKKYAWCACGLSKKQPWCDGAHKTTALKPIVFTAEEGKLWMCGCKATNTKPFCDGSHNTV